MSSIKRGLLTIAVIGFGLLVGGCSVSFGNTGTKTIDGGVWRSDDNGKTWTQKVTVPTASGKPGSIANVQVRRMIFDPQDYNTVYLITEGEGIIYSYDNGQTWRQFDTLKKAKTRAMAVDPRNKCLLYVTVDNKLFRSIDCGRTWDNPYYHQNNQTLLTDVAVDYNNSSIVYLTTSSGEILKSSNGGTSWEQLHRGDGSFVEIILNKKDSKVIYAATLKNGLFKSIDGGKTWDSPSTGLKAFSSSNEYKALLMDKNNPDTIILVSLYNMFKSVDGGKKWEQIKLLPGPKSVALFSAALNPKNSNEIYYTTRTAFLKSSDGGNTWVSAKLPFSRIANKILINPENPNMIYLGTYNAQ